jgi:carbamoyltransferase
LKELLGNPRDKDQKVENKHMNLAHSAQLMYEEAFFHLLNKLYNKYDMKKLCLSGGCAMNSVANGKIYENTSFEKVYVPPAAGDAGGSIGAAYNVWYNAKIKSKSKTKQTMDHAFWGPGFDRQDISKLLNKYDQRLQQEDCAITEVNDDLALCKKTAEYIEEGRVVGWFEGRMELGPRALGNRSIVSDPRRSNMKDILNLKIKRREPFRPFAPSILREHVKDWFETDDNVPFMNKVFQIKEDKRKQIPAVTHTDGSGRLQTVSKESNTLYYNLINEFRSLTGIPIVLNTSFNENEPIVCTPEEALECFLRTKMDVVVLNSFIIIRN